eukprot:PhF_6_TR40517/c1_g1_i1/m.60662
MRSFMPIDYVPGASKSVTVELGGRDRYKFFKRPVVSALTTQDAGGQTMANQHLGFNVTKPTIQYARQPQSPQQPTKPRPKRKLDNSAVITSNAAQVLANGKVDMQTQTDMRENDSQTDPYTPDYIVEEGAQPEVLAIQSLKYGEGLPAGLAEVDMIDRIRRRRAVEASFPQGNDDGAMQQRLEALENLEHVEWEEREQHIKQLQDERLLKMKVALEEREMRREQATNDRITAFHQQRLQNMEGKMKKLKENRMKVTRKVTHEIVDCVGRTLPPTRATQHEDIISSHVHYGKRGAPVTTNSLVEKVSTTNYDVRPTLLGFVEGLQELERTKVPVLEKVPARNMLPPSEPLLLKLHTNFQKRIERQISADLDHANQTILKNSGHEDPNKLRNVQDRYRATPRLHRPDTPTLVLQGDEEEEREEALVLLQRLLRGRAVQNDFFDGKERCHGLIEELQAAQNAKDNEGYWVQQKEFEAFRKKQEAMVDSVVQGAVGDVVFGTLDYLYKELVRQQEAAKFDALRVHAENTRKERENEEDKRREAETTLRRREEEQYRMMMMVHDHHAVTLLQQIMQTATVESATEQALYEQAEVAATRKAATKGDADKEDIVCDIMDRFVLPEVARQTSNKQGRTQEATLTNKAKAEVAHSVSMEALKK